MKPSIQHWANDSDNARSKIEQGFKNCAFSIEDFILHFCIRKYLCKNNETYYVTDLSKGSMSVRKANEDRIKRYERWYPLLKKELILVAKPKAPVIAIGQQVHGFLKKKEGSLPRELAGSILHYSQQAGVGREVAHTLRPREYRKFSSNVKLDDVVNTSEAVMKEGKFGETLMVETISQLKSKPCLGKSEKKLMFTYKAQFAAIRRESSFH